MPEETAAKAPEEAAEAQTAPLAETEEAAALREENAALRAELTKLSGLVHEMSNQTRDEVVEEATTPTLDWDELVFEDPDTVKERLAEYGEEVRDAARKEAENEMMERLKPVVEEIRAREEALEREEMLRRMNESEKMPGFRELFPRIDAFVKQNGALYGGVSPQEAYVNAYLAQKGYEAISGNDAPSEDAMFLYYQENPGFQKRIEEARMKQAQAGEEVPVFAPSEGAGGAALSLPKKPKNFEEAKRMAERFRS